MKFNFTVGNMEKHEVEFYFNQFWGNISIKIDGQEKIKDLQMFSLSLSSKYDFEVGQSEKHKVVIEKIRKLLFAGFRKQKYNVFVDGVLIQEHEGF